MKSFFQSGEAAVAPVRPGADKSASPVAGVAVVTRPTPGRGEDRPLRCAARIAVYEAPAAAPRTEDVTATTAHEFVEAVSARAHTLSREAGGSIPYTVIRELVENFIHADFAEPVISVLDRGSTLRFADQGPGVPDKERALLPGFTTATTEMKDVIRGVGSGLPIVRDFLEHSGGSVVLEDNLRDGTVVTISAYGPSSLAALPPETAADAPEPASQRLFDAPSLTTRQKQVLSLVLELGEAGPTVVSKELSVALSTAYRDLAFLETSGLIQADETGKRVLTEAGALFLDDMFGR